MRRVWQIFEVEDQPDLNEKLGMAISKLIGEPTLKLIYQLQMTGLICSGQGPLGDAVYAKSELDNDPVGIRNFSIQSKGDFFRIPLFTQITTLEDAWEIFPSIYSTCPVDIVVLDIKLHEYDSVRELDDKCRKILFEYTNHLNPYSAAFGGKKQSPDQFDRNQIKEFRQCGGLILYGMLQRLQESQKNERIHSGLPPLIHIQTASKAIDQFSVLEYAFPQYVRVYDKSGLNIEVYKSLFLTRIKEMLESGELDQRLLRQVVDGLRSPCNKDEYRNLLLTNLRQNDNASWCLLTLAPWICSNLINAQTQELRLKALVELEACLAEVIWTDKVGNYFESPEACVLHNLMHPYKAIGNPPRTLHQLNNISVSLRCALDALPTFLKDHYNGLRNDPSLDCFCEFWDKLNFIQKSSATTGLEVLALRDLDVTWFDQEFKKKMRGERVPAGNIRDIFNELNITQRFCITMMDNVKLLELVQRSNFNALGESRPIYFPWFNLHVFVKTILDDMEKESCGTKPPPLSIGVFEEEKRSELRIELYFPKAEHRCLDHLGFKGAGSFCSTLNALKNWCTLYVSSNGKRRNLHVTDPHIGILDLPTMKRRNGVEYTIIIPW